ncbi:MAG TPA: ATP-binding cassette domain-containing protein [Actinomycetota bacterium]|nr:ATP-binding cassette domain-containing protein [Actinomycetota bacterium]
MPSTVLLDVAHATVWVPGPTTLLADISWSVAAGEHWALLGPNGAGKSTLLRLAAGLRHPSSGTVEVLGRRLGRVDVRRLWALIGFVNPVHPTPPELSLADVVLTGATGTVQPLWAHYGPEDRSRASELLSLMGIAGLAGRAFGLCSQGEQGRALIARALMPAPRLILLDEPTAGLDMAGREDLLEALSGLARSSPDLASVVVAHHLEDLPVTTTHALLLNGARAVARGPVCDVITDEVISRGFGVDVHVVRTAGRWAAVRAAS